MSSKKRQQTFAKLKREQAVRERRERKQEAKKAARELKAAARRGELPADDGSPVDVENPGGVTEDPGPSGAEGAAPEAPTPAQP